MRLWANDEAEFNRRRAQFLSESPEIEYQLKYGSAALSTEISEMLDDAIKATMRMERAEEKIDEVKKGVSLLSAVLK